MTEKAKTASPRTASLRFRLTLFSVIALVVTLSLVGFALDAAYRNSAETGLRQQMETWAYVMLASLEVDEEGRVRLIVDPVDPVLQQPGSGVYTRIETSEDRWESLSTLGETLPETEALAGGETRFTNPQPGTDFYLQQYGLSWELPNGDLLPVTVSVLVATDWLYPQLEAFRAGIWQSLAAVIVLLALVQAFSSAVILRPLKKVAADVARVESGDASSLEGPYPEELEPLRRNVDHLLQTEHENQARYRHALDSLAHSLKTPLAVIRAGLSGMTGTSATASQQAVEDMQLLIATRLERAAAGTRRALGAPIAVQPVAERIARSLRRIHSQELRNLELIIEPGLKFYGEERDLMEMLGNLLENACKYGQGQVRLEAGALEPAALRPGLWLAVSNDGPVVDLSQFVQRGVRGDERAEGHGLGLTIVSEVVRAYGGDMRFNEACDAEPGTRVLLHIPPDGRG